MSSFNIQQQLHALWSAALETWCHELLFMRQVYPRDTFAPTKFLGVSCQACRHPGVVRYITNTLQVIVPSILSGSATEVSVVMLKDAFTVSETYTLSVSSSVALDGDMEGKDVLEYTERGMRDLILSLLSLESLPRMRCTDEASFKLTMRTVEKVDALCPEMTKAFDEGTWYQPNSGTVNDSDELTGKVRPLYHVSLPSGGTLQMNLITKGDN